MVSDGFLLSLKLCRLKFLFETRARPCKAGSGVGPATATLAVASGAQVALCALSCLGVALGVAVGEYFLRHNTHHATPTGSVCAGAVSGRWELVREGHFVAYTRPRVLGVVPRLQRPPDDPTSATTLSGAIVASVEGSPVGH